MRRKENSFKHCAANACECTGKRIHIMVFLHNTEIFPNKQTDQDLGSLFSHGRGSSKTGMSSVNGIFFVRNGISDPIYLQCFNSFKEKIIAVVAGACSGRYFGPPVSEILMTK